MSSVNTEVILNKLKRAGVELYEVKKIDVKNVRLCVKITDEQKFFAIVKDLCYNIKKEKNRGSMVWFYRLLRSPGILFGSIAFAIICIFFSNVILSFSFTGNGSVYKEEIIKYFESENIKKFSLFSSIELDTLADEIVTQFDRYSFVSCKKRGNRLVVEMVLAKNEGFVNKNGAKELYSDSDGVVKDIKVYRGTALVSVGDQVKSGDLLISGYMDVKDKRVETGALAIVTLSIKKEKNYISDIDNDEMALTFAQAFCEEGCLVVIENKEKLNGKYYYKLSIYLDRVIYTG